MPSAPPDILPSPTETEPGFEPAPLPVVYGMLRDADEVRQSELARLDERMAPSRTPSTESCRRGALLAVSLDAKPTAISLLRGGGAAAADEGAEVSLEVERDLLLSCLVAGFVSPQTQLAAITATADRLCTAGKLQLAVPLLFLVDRGADACERLQRAGQWERAAVLAKASLSASARAGVLGKWVDHLLSSGDTQRAIEVLLSLGRVQEVAERLIEQCAFSKAALLLCALREAHSSRRGALTGFAFRGAARVLLEYAAFLSRLELHALSERYCGLAATTADALGAPGSEDEAITDVEAKQLVVQLARLQRVREEQQ